MSLGKRIGFSFLVFLICSVPVMAQKSPASESDLKRQAEKYFQTQEYVKATPMYSQLLSLYPRDPIYNYRYGICLFQSGKDRTGAASYLQEASRTKEMDPDVWFYLGRSYMYMDRYNEAIQAFNDFIRLGSGAKLNKLHPDLYILNCKNANELKKDRKNAVVMDKQKVNRSVFFTAYDFSNAAGKMLTTPERFLSPLDKEKLKDPVMFMTKDAQTIYLASYGKKGDTGKDIYRILRLPDGNWGEPVNLGGAVNTVDDEDYPYLDKDGRTLYYCSKAFNSIGGYDIFKSQYDFNTGKWSDPANIGIPINTVDDDIFYMPSVKGESAVYATAIECESGQIEVRRIGLGGNVKNVAVISGLYLSKDQVTRRDARISILKSDGQGVVTTVRTDPRTGEYELVLPAGEDYMMVVEGGSYLPHAENFSIPAAENLPVMKQRVTLNKAGDVEQLTLSNFFTPSVSDPMAVVTEKPTEEVKSEINVKEDNTAKMRAVVVDGKTLYVAPPANQAVSKTADLEKKKVNEEPAVEQKTGVTETAGETAIEGQPAETTGKTETAPHDEKNVAEHQHAEHALPDTVAGSTTATGGDQETAKTDSKPVETQPGKEDVKSKTAAEEKTGSGKEELNASGQSSNAELETAAAQTGKQDVNSPPGADEKSTLEREDLKTSGEKENAPSEPVAIQEDKQKEKTAAPNSIEEKNEDFKVTAEYTDSAAQPGKVETVKQEDKTSGTETVSVQGSEEMKAGDVKEADKALEETAPAGTAARTNAQPVNEKTSSMEIVKMAFDDAIAIKEEALSMKVEAKQCKTEAVMLDSLSKAQVKEANQLLVSGEKEQSQLLFRQSQTTVQQAVAKQNEAQSLETEAKEKEKEANESLQQAAELMKEFKVDTFSVAYRELKAAEEETLTSNAEAGNVSTVAPGEESREQNEPAPAINTHRSRSVELDNAVDALSVRQMELDQKLENTTDKKEKTALSKESRELAKEMQDKRSESKKELALALKEEAKGSPAVAENKKVSAEPAEELAVNGADSKQPGEMTPLNQPGTAQKNEEVSRNESGENTGKGIDAKLEKEISTAPASGAASLQTEQSIDEPITSTAPIAPEAASHYSTYRLKIAESQKNEKLAAATQQQLLVTSNKQERDSLVVVSNNLSRQSIRQWQEAQNELSKAIEIEPAIEEKSLANSGSVIRKPVADELKTAGAAPATNAAKVENNPPSTVDNTSASVPSENKKSEQNIQPKDEKSPVAADRTPEKQDVPSQESAAVVPGSPAQPSVREENRTEPFSSAAKSEATPFVAITDEALDTTRPEYPEYVAVQGQIKGKQEHTVMSFIDGMKLTRKADELKKEEMDLRDRAEVMSEGKTKTDLLSKADILKSESDSISEISREMLTTAQQDTREVKVLTVRSEELKKVLTAAKNTPSQKDPDPAPLEISAAETTPNTNPESEKTVNAQGKPKAAQPATAAEQVPEKADDSDAGNAVAAQDAPAKTETEQTTDPKINSGNQTGTAAATPEAKPAVKEQPFNETTIAENAAEPPGSLKVNTPGAVQPSEISAFNESDVFSYSKGDAYRETDPIPMDPTLPEGLVFKVQIGAFRSPLPDNTFKNLKPLSGETTRPGWIRYCLGLFRSFEPANLLKKEVRGTGYKDAFVVAYYNGKRIALFEAYALLNKSNAAVKAQYAAVSGEEVRNLAKYDIRPDKFDAAADEDAKAFFGTTERIASDLVEYAVQVGVYKSSRTPSALQAMLPVNTEETKSGLYRFTTGRFRQYAAADSMRRVAVGNGIRDAFIVIYRGGKKVSGAESRALMAQRNSGVPATTVSQTQASAAAIPLNAGDLSFKVQVGAFRENVPFSAVSSLLQLTSVGITQETNSRGLHIFYAGDFPVLQEATVLRAEIASKGIKDAFVVAFAKGKRISMGEALRALNRK